MACLWMPRKLIGFYEVADLYWNILEHPTASAETPLSTIEMENGAAAQIAPAAVSGGG